MGSRIGKALAEAVQFEQRITDGRAGHGARAWPAGRDQFAGRCVLRAILQSGGRGALDQLAAAQDGGIQPHGARQAEIAGEDQQRHMTITIGGQQRREQLALLGGAERIARLVADEESGAAIEAAGEFGQVRIGPDEARGSGGKAPALCRHARW